MPRVFRGRDAVAAGLLTRGQLRGPQVQRLLPGVYAAACLRRTHSLVCEAAGLALPPAAMLTGASLATVRGLHLLGPDDDVEVVLPESAYRCRVRGVQQRRAVVALAAPVGRHGETPCAGPLRMAFDLAARCPLDEAVARLDAAAHAGLVDLPSLRRALPSVRERDVRGVRRAADLADSRAESMPESKVRVLLYEAGIATTPQVRVQAGDGRVVARVDLAVDGVRVAVEYDGAWHGSAAQLPKDRARLNALLDAGWEVVHVTADMLRDDPDAVVAAVRRAIARARRAA